MNNDGSLALGSFLLFVAAVIYFIPTIVAFNRKVSARTGICILNVALGWSGLGWLGALIWAVVGEREGKVAPVAIYQPEAQKIAVDDTKKCPRCAETIKAEALICRYCGADFSAKPE